MQLCFGFICSLVKRLYVCCVQFIPEGTLETLPQLAMLFSIFYVSVVYIATPVSIHVDMCTHMLTQHENWYNVSNGIHFYVLTVGPSSRLHKGDRSEAKRKDVLLCNWSSGGRWSYSNLLHQLQWVTLAFAPPTLDLYSIFNIPLIND